MNCFLCSKQIPTKQALLKTLKGHSDLYAPIIEENTIYFQDIVYPDYNRARALINKVFEKEIILSVWYYDENSKSVKTIIGISDKFIRISYQEEIQDIVILDDVDIPPTQSKFSSSDLYYAIDEFRKNIM